MRHFSTKILSAGIILALGLGLSSCSTGSKVAKNGIKVRQEVSLKNIKPGEWFSRSGYKDQSVKMELEASKASTKPTMTFRDYVRSAPQDLLAMNSTTGELVQNFRQNNLTTPVPSYTKYQGFRGLMFKTKHYLFSPAPAGGSVNSLALIGFISSIVGIFFASLLFGAAAVVLCALGLSEINKGNGSGKGFAIVGLVLGVLEIILGVMIIMALAAAA